MKKNMIYSIQKKFPTCMSQRPIDYSFSSINSSSLLSYDFFTILGTGTDNNHTTTDSWYNDYKMLLYNSWRIKINTNYFDMISIVSVVKELIQRNVHNAHNQPCVLAL